MKDSQESQPPDFDALLQKLGEFGRFQIYYYLLVCIPTLFASAGNLNYVFAVGSPNYRCFVPQCEQINTSIYDSEWTKWALPYSIKDNELLTVKNQFCDMYEVDLGRINGTCSEEIFTNKTVQCTEWIFDEVEHTIVNDWNLTCSNNLWKLSLVGSSHFAGVVLGSLISGYLADRFGRKTIFILCNMLMSITGILTAFSPNYITYIVLVFVNAVANAGVYPLAFILGVEMVGKKHCEFFSLVLNYFYAMGEALVGLLAWYTKDWVYLQLIVSAPPIVFFIYHWFMHESVRWLLANNRQQEAKKIIYKVAKVNKTALSDDLMIDLNKQSLPIRREKHLMLPIILEVLNSRKLVLRYVLIFIIWFIIAFIFYGLSINSQSLSGDKYMNFAMSGLVEIPGYTLSWFSIRKIGRKYTLTAALIISGLTCMATIFVQTDNAWFVVPLFLFGKSSITAAFGAIYIYTAEMFPTIIRSTSVGLASTLATLGGVLAPFVPLLGLYVPELPMLLFGASAILAGLCSLNLPETLGAKLPETVAEARNL